jgi:hypothetical protein
MRSASSAASRVLPLPPAPVNVTSRCALTSASRSRNSRSRPTSDVSDTGGREATATGESPPARDAERKCMRQF